MAVKETTHNKFASFTAKNVKNLEAKVRATAFGLTINYPLPEPDACKGLIDSACPLESGDLATYKLGMHLTEIIPEVSSH
jgi:Niemann-Pick C2 protein